jgi:autotransporter-associated beta strand protein
MKSPIIRFLSKCCTHGIGLAAVIHSASAQLPAFPGAEGYGSTASGGRGGDVYTVTNLHASGAGSFADAIASAPSQGRTIVFAVSGHIRLPSGSGGGLSINRNKITVAGQTAPGDGICFWNNTMNLTGNDMVIRNIRWRYGKQTAGGDSVVIANSQRIIIDHCDVMFSTDENLSSFGTPPEFFTFQWSINAWGLQNHSCGGLWDINHATSHHTLWANNHTRNPKCISPSVFDWANNVTFGWNNGFNMAASTDPIARVNIRSSWFIHGGSTSSAVYGGGLNDTGQNVFQLHMNDSALDGSNNGILDVTRTNHAMVSSSQYTQSSSAWPQTVDGNAANPIIGTRVTLDARNTAYKKVLSKAGAVRMEISSRPLRDEITQLCVNRVMGMQRSIISDPLQLNLSTGTSFASLQSAPAPADRDLDGMPDEWEDAVGYDKNVKDNNTLLTTAQTTASFFPSGSPTGYTRLEEYLHFKSVPHATVARNTINSPSFIEIDLRKFTAGFSANPTFTLSNLSNGTIVQSGPGNALVRFTPNQDFSGRAGFLFTVADAAGDSWTQQCCLLVSTQIQPRPVFWVGGQSANLWDTSSINFRSLTAATAFMPGDAVSIDDTGSNSPNMQLSGTLTPASLRVSNTTKNFIISGSGSLSSTGEINKSGTGTLTISNTGPNSFGSASIDAGTLSLTTANAIGSAPLTLRGGTLAFSTDVSNPFVIAGTVALQPTGSRSLSGSWTGSGTVQINNTGSNLLTLQGNTSGFSGNVDFASSTGSARLFGSLGSANAAFDLGTGSLRFYNRNGGSSFQIGSITGGSNTSLSGADSATTLTTYTIGALSTSTTFAGRFTNGGQGATAITKTGNGTLTLSGNSTHSGATLINQGSLELLGSASASAFQIAAGAKLSGTGTIGSSLTTATGGIISPGAADGNSAGTLTVGSLQLNSSTLTFDLSSNPTAGNDRITITNNGSATFSGTIHFAFNLIDGTLSPGTYELISTGGSINASGALLTSNLPTGSRQTLTLEIHSGGIRLVVSGTNSNLIWTGANGALWDRQTTAAWSGATPAVFFNQDSALFNDSSSQGTVNITQPVAPRLITVNNSSSRSYTFTGAPITGNSSLVKSGNGSLTLLLPRFDLENCSISATSPIVTVSSTAGLLPGMTVISKATPALIPAGTFIVSVNNATSVTLSQNPTATSSTARVIFETRHTYSGGTVLHDGTLTLASNSWEYYSSAYPPPANPYGLGTGPITLNGGTLTLLGHSVSTLHVSGPLPNDLIVPAGKTATLRSVMRGTYLGDIAGLRGSLTGAGTLNLVVNFNNSAITGDWSAFTGTLQVTRPSSGAVDPCFQLGNSLGLPLANVHLDQVTLCYTATASADGVTIPIGSLSGTNAATTIVAGALSSNAPVTWQIGGLDSSTTFAGNFTPYPNKPIGLEKIGSGTLTLTGTGTVNVGITVKEGTLAYGDSASDALGGTGEISISPTAALQLNSGATLTGSFCEVFNNATLRGNGTLQAPVSSSGAIAVMNGALNIVGNLEHDGVLSFSSLTDRLTVSGNLQLAGTMQLPASGLSTGRKVLATYTGTWSTTGITLQEPANYLGRIDTTTPGEVAVRLIDRTGFEAWQVTHFGNTTLASAQPNADPDVDGSTNFQEYENGSNPNDHLPQVLTISSNNSSTVFTSLNSSYTDGVLNWTNGGTLSNRSVQSLVLDTTVRGGTIDMGAASNVLTLTSGQIQFQGSNSLNLSGGQIGASGSSLALLTSGSGTLTLSSPLSGGAGSVSISGSASILLNTPNTFTGGLTLNGGSLTQGIAGALGPNGSTLTIHSGTLDLNGIAANPGILTGNGGSITSASATTLSLGSNTSSGGNFAGSLTGPIALNRVGNTHTNSATLSGSNLYSGNTTLGAGSGTLILAHNLALGLTPAVTISGTGAALALANGVTVNEIPLTLRGSGANNGSAGNFSGALTTSDQATASWRGSITLGDANARIGTGINGTLFLSGPLLGSGSNQSITFSSGSGSNVGTVVLSGSSSFTGNISLVRGTLRLAASHVLPATAIIDVGSANVTDPTSFDLNGFSQTLAGLRRTSTNGTQSSTVTNSSTTPATLTLQQSTNLSYSGRITGSLSVVKSGSGTLTLTRSDALSASLNLMLDGGALSISSAHTIAGLRINGAWMPAGTYTSSQGGGRIAGTGSLIVTTDGPINFTSWIDGFTSLNAAQKLPTADPDGDGINNLLEYVMNGSPLDASASILPTATRNATHFLFSFTQREESHGSIEQNFEFGSRLDNWTPLRITGPSAAEVTFGPVVNGARTVTVMIPLTASENGRMFGRLNARLP